MISMITSSGTPLLLYNFQAREGESDPLVTVENGSGVVTDTVTHGAPGWDSNKDLRA